MKTAITFTVVLALAASLKAQTDALQAPGLVPGASYQHTDIDSVNMQNGIPIFHIPIYSLPQRGRLSLTFTLIGSGMNFASGKNPDCTNTVYKCYMVGGGADHALRWTWDQPLFARFTQYRYPPNSNTFYNVYSIVDSTGASHPLGDDNSNRSLWRSTDGSGFLFAPSYDPNSPNFGGGDYTIYQPDGVRHIFNQAASSVTMQDPDGNSIVEIGTQITDSLGRIIPSPTMSTSSTSGCPTINANWQPTTGSYTWTVPGANGTQQTYLFCNTTITYRTSFWPNYPPTCFTQCQEKTGTANLLQSVVLPNGTYWAFTYDAANPADNSSIGYGQITQVRLPTGGTISYEYVNYYQSCNTPPSLGRAVSKRTLDPGNGEPLQTWTYSFPYINSMPWLNTATDPQGNDTVYSFSTLTSACDVHEIKRQSYQGSQSSGALLTTTTTAYQYATGNPQSGVFSGGNAATTLAVLPSSITTTLQNGLATTTSFQYNDGGFVDVQLACTAGPNYSYSCTPSAWSTPLQIPFGQATSATITDYSGATLKTVQKQYLYQQNASYLAGNFLDLVSSKTTFDGSGYQVAQTTYGYDENNGSPQGVFGNRTSANLWLNTTGGSVTSQSVYNSQGMVSQSIDPLLNTTTYTYDSTGAFLSQVQRPDTTANGAVVHHTVNYTHDPVTGSPLTSTDENQHQTSYAYDAMNRVTQIDYADGGQKIYNYSDVPGTYPVYVMETTKLDATNVTRTWTGFDGLGRKIRSAKLNGEASPNVLDMSDTCYDALGRVATQNYPFQGPGWGQGTNCTLAGDSFTYDALGRVTQVTHPDGSHVNTDYSQFPVVTVTDETGKQRRNQTDALGRLTTVWEPDGNANLSYETVYYYDTLDNLIGVDQMGGDPSPDNWRQRRFQYDSLSRLTFASNPESGAIYYGYDNNGNLISKISPMPNQTGASQIQFLFGYDQLNRLIWRWNYTQSADPVDRFWYDLSSVWGTPVNNSIGRLVLSQSDGGTNGSVGTIYSYDGMGREEFELEYNKRNDFSVHKQFNYNYNLDGSLKSMTYPSGRVLNYGYNAAQRPFSAVDNNGISFAANAHYFASGALGYVVHGATSSFGGIVASANYNARMQPNEIGAAVGAQPPLLDLIYDYYSCNGNGGNDGNVCAITNTKDSARSQAFAYDYLNRLIWAWTPNLNSGGQHNWGESFTYDPWGNLLQKGVMGSDNPPDPSLNVAVNSKNQVMSWCYDSAGNIIDPTLPCPSSPPSSYPNIYDGQNRLTSAKVGAVTTSYDYDADGERIKKTGSTGTLYWYGSGGRVLEETDLNGNLKNEYIFFGGKRTARYSPTNGYSYYFSDHLGSANVVTDANGSIKEESDFYPFGGERKVIDLGFDNHYRFTGKERDPETGCDYFGARYYCNPIGRFITPDWAAGPTTVPYANFGNPQSLNLYSYVKNNPTTFGDPDGHCDVDGEHHWGWCLWHTLGFYRTKKEQAAEQQRKAAELHARADQARKELAELTRLRIDGQKAADWVKNASDEEVLAKEREFVLTLEYDSDSITATTTAAIVVPTTPGGMSNSEFGKDVMKWGTGDEAARARMQTLTREELEKAGVTKEMAQQWRDFYRQVKAANPGNPSAEGRAELMQRALELLGGQ